MREKLCEKIIKVPRGLLTAIVVMFIVFFGFSIAAGIDSMNDPEYNSFWIGFCATWLIPVGLGIIFGLVMIIYTGIATLKEKCAAEHGLYYDRAYDD